MSSVAELAGGPRFLGTRRDYSRLLSRGAVLLLLTLGIYRFWLMTDVRRFLWCHTEITARGWNISVPPLSCCSAS
jgi:uncharacterized membrane protein YjgN (DUF898 family)